MAHSRHQIQREVRISRGPKYFGYMSESYWGQRAKQYLKKWLRRLERRYGEHEIILDVEE